MRCDGPNPILSLQHLGCKDKMFIACPVCSQGYDENGGHRPLIIPCGHTFCEACIKNMTQMGSFVKCPICTKTAPFQLDNLALNLALLDIVTQGDETKSTDSLSALCDSCSNNQLACYCQQCDMLICSGCIVHSCIGQGHQLVRPDLEAQARKSLLTEHVDALQQDFGELFSKLQEECNIVLETLQSEDNRLSTYYDRIITEATNQKNRLNAQIEAGKTNNLNILGEVQKVMDAERERILSLLVKVNDKKPYALIREFKNIEKIVGEMKSIPHISFEVAAFSAPSIHVGGEVVMKRMKVSVDSNGKAKRVLTTPPDASRTSLTSASSIFVSAHQLWALPRLWQEYTTTELLDGMVRELKAPIYIAKHLSGLLIYDSDSVVRVGYPTGNECGGTFLQTKVFKNNVSRVVGMWSAGTPTRDFIAQDRLLSYRLQKGETSQWYTIRNIWEGVLDCAFVNDYIFLCKVSMVEIWKLSFNSEDDTKVQLECLKKIRHDTNAVAIAGSSITEEIYVCDKSHSCIHVWSLEGELLRRISIPGVPISICVAPDGVLLVGTAEGRVSVMYPTGELILMIMGEELGGFHSITSIVVKEFDGSIYLCDPYRHRVIVGVLSPFAKNST